MYRVTRGGDLRASKVIALLSVGYVHLVRLTSVENSGKYYGGAFKVCLSDTLSF